MDGDRPGRANGSAPSASRVGEPVMPSRSASAWLVTTRRVIRERPASIQSSRAASKSAPGHPGTCRISRVMIGSIPLVPHG